MNSQYFEDILEIYSDGVLVAASSFQSVVSHLGVPDLVWYSLDKNRFESLLAAVSDLLVIGNDEAAVKHLAEFKEGDGTQMVELVLGEDDRIEPDSNDIVLVVIQLNDGTFSYWLAEAMDDYVDQ